MWALPKSQLTLSPSPPTAKGWICCVWSSMCYRASRSATSSPQTSRFYPPNKGWGIMEIIISPGDESDMKITLFPRQCYYTEEKEMKNTHFVSQKSRPGTRNAHCRAGYCWKGAAPVREQINPTFSHFSCHIWEPGCWAGSAAFPRKRMECLEARLEPEGNWCWDRRGAWKNLGFQLH